ncbi:MAG TPA: lysine transporter LysE [Devosia sp.]
MTDPLLFFFAVLAILGAPGPTNALLATAGAMGGVRAALPLAMAALAGYLIAILLIRGVLSPVIAAWPVVGTVLKVMVAAYVAWIALRLWARPAGAAAARRVDFRMVLITTLLNPKAIIVALTIIPLAHPDLWLYYAGFSVLVLGTGLGWILMGGAIGAATGGTRQHLLQRIAAVVLGAFAGMILASALG